MSTEGLKMPFYQSALNYSEGLIVAVILQNWLI